MHVRAQTSATRTVRVFDTLRTQVALFAVLANRATLAGRALRFSPVVLAPHVPVKGLNNPKPNPKPLTCLCRSVLARRRACAQVSSSLWSFAAQNSKRRRCIGGCELWQPHPLDVHQNRPSFFWGEGLPAARYVRGEEAVSGPGLDLVERRGGKGWWVR